MRRLLSSLMLRPKAARTVAVAVPALVLLLLFVLSVVDRKHQHFNWPFGGRKGGNSLKNRLAAFGGGGKDGNAGMKKKHSLL